MPAGLRIGVRLVPRADRTSVDGVVGGRLRVRVTAAPVDGSANDALVRLLAAELGLSRRSLRIVTGLRSRDKVVEVLGVEPDVLLARWPGLAV
ncbi:MAG TPA: DUF167 domain-containing protein [Candidatus Limnocylindrales bacterium]|nr:DUF167 domain-containing protein [Candidatus Limnocylindrales bacterium]